MRIYLFLIACFMIFYSSFAQTPFQRSILVDATVSDSPASITLNFRKTTSTTGTYTIRRKLKTEKNFTFLANASSSAANPTFTDNTVTAGIEYEYAIFDFSNPTSQIPAYICSGIKVPAKEVKGKVLLLVDNTFTTSLAPEITRFIADLEGDGWGVLRRDIARTASVNSIRAMVKEVYESDYINALQIIGHVAVPYTGGMNPDGHPDHYGAWPADGIYGDIYGTYTDVQNINSASTLLDERNRNIAGDGKFDQTNFSGEIKLQIGRVDFFNMPLFPQSETQLLRNYFNKNHDYRHKVFSLPNRGFIDDDFNGRSESFASNGFITFSALCGKNNITSNYAPDNTSNEYKVILQNTPYLWTYGAGGGWFTGAWGLSSTNELVNSNIQSVFSMYFGSYFGDWDSPNNFLRAALAQGKVLTNVWAGRPFWMLHFMGMGENIAYSARLLQENNHNYQNNQSGETYIGLMGDLSLKAQIVFPASNFTLTTSAGNNVTLNWTASNDVSITGYNIYKKSDDSYIYQKLNTSLITTTTFSATIPSGNHTFMLRAEKEEISPSGNFFNLSQGVFATLNFPVSSAPASMSVSASKMTSTVSGEVISMSAQVLPITASQNTQWSVELSHPNLANINTLTGSLTYLHPYFMPYGYATVTGTSIQNPSLKQTIVISLTDCNKSAGDFSNNFTYVCENKECDVALALPTLAGINYAWSVTGSKITIVSSNSNTAIIKSTASNFFDNSYINVTPSLGACVGLPSTKFIQGFAYPVDADFSVTGGGLTFCQNATTTSIRVSFPPSWFGQGNSQWFLNSTLTSSIKEGGVSYFPISTSTGVQEYFVRLSRTASYEYPKLYKQEHCYGNFKTATVTVLSSPLPTAPSASKTYCLNLVPDVLTALGTNLKWYNSASGGTSSVANSFPVTTLAGVQYNYVTQSQNVCESPRLAIATSVTGLSSTPVLDPPVPQSKIYYCTGDAAKALTVTGANLKWYTNSIGGIGSNTVSLPATNVAGIQYNFVTQNQNTCESQRLAITTYITDFPQAPTAIPTIGNPTIYCQNAASASLSAVGINLKWYTSSSGGIGVNTAPLPLTSIVGSFNNYVSQTINTCESPRLTLTTSITGLPIAPVKASNATYPSVYCLDANPEPLTAVGTSLKWYTNSIGGVSSNMNALPITSLAGLQNNYVSQTLNGCESARLLITTTIASSPPAPVLDIFALVICSNIPARPLTALGENLSFYTSTSSSIKLDKSFVPVATAGGLVSTYFVSQQIENCESKERLLLDVYAYECQIFDILSILGDLSLEKGETKNYTLDVSSPSKTISTTSWSILPEGMAALTENNGTLSLKALQEGMITITGTVFYTDYTSDSKSQEITITPMGPITIGGLNLESTFIKLNLKIVPNPSQGIFAFETESEMASILIENLSGNMVYEQKCNQKMCNVDLTHVSNGVYFAKVKMKDLSIIRAKVVVQK